MNPVRQLGNTISYTLSKEWQQSDTDFFNVAIPFIISQLEELVGPSFLKMDVLIKYVPGKRGGIKIYNPQLDEQPRIELGEIYSFKLLAHELYHAWICPYNLGVSHILTWTESLASFEESMAHAAAEIIELNYQEKIDNSYQPEINRYTAIYDLYNQDYLTSRSFWADRNGMNKTIVKYEMGATAIRKLLVIRPEFYKNLFSLVAERINNGKGPVTNITELDKLLKLLNSSSVIA